MHRRGLRTLLSPQIRFRGQKQGTKNNSTDNTGEDHRTSPLSWRAGLRDTVISLGGKVSEHELARLQSLLKRRKR